MTDDDEDERRPYARLAASVIEQAVRDLDNPNAPARVRETAADFLGGGTMLAFWCERLNLNPEACGSGRYVDADRPALDKGRSMFIQSGPSMSPKELTAFRMAPEIMAGLRKVKDRDGVPMSVQVDRALRAWLRTRGVETKAASRRVGARRKA